MFPDARAVPPASMQRIASEINLSETTFVLPAERDDTDVRMRIFTPAVELPMAGHPDDRQHVCAGAIRCNRGAAGRDSRSD